MTNKLKYKDICTASYYGDVRMVKKLLGDEPLPEGEEIDFDAQEAKEENWARQVNEPGTVKTYANAVRFQEFGLGFDIFETEDTDVFSHLFKCSRKSSHIPASPLHWAVLGAELELVKYLLRKGARTRSTAGPFDATPKDISVANDLPAVFNFFSEEEVRTLGQMEDIRDDLLHTFDELAHRTPALSSRAAIEITKSQQDTQSLEALSQDRSEAKREPARSQEYIKLLSQEEAVAAHAAFENKSRGKDFLTELASNIAGCTIGQLTLLAKRLSAAVKTPENLADIQLLALLLFSCDSTSLKELLFLPPEETDDVPDIHTAVLTDSSTTSDAPTQWGYLTHLVSVAVQSPLSDVTDAFLHLKEPTEEQAEKIKTFEEGSVLALGGITVLGLSEEGKKESLSDTGIVFVFNKVTEGVDIAKVCSNGSRFPTEAELVIPCFSSYTVTKIEPPAEDTPGPTVITLEPSPGPVVARLDTSSSVKLLTECDKWQKQFLNLRALKAEAARYHQPAPPEEGAPEGEEEEEAQPEEADPEE